MIEEVAKEIYRIGVPLPKNPLKELNSYFIRGRERDLLIDTGFRCQECEQALLRGLEELGSEPARRDVLITHIHSDHSGMADLMVGPGGKVYMSRTDLGYLRRVCSGETRNALEARFLTEGFPDDVLDSARRNNPARTMAMPRVPEDFIGLEAGDTLRAGDYCLRAVAAPGHTPGNMMFWAEEQGLMFCGDHILFDITPNITAWIDVEDSLGLYLENLERAKNFPVKKALPGHRKAGDYHARIDQLIAHHHRRLTEVLRIVGEEPEATAYEITRHMTWKIRSRNWEEFPDAQKWFAVGECLAHLDYLRKRGLIRRENTDGIWHYETAASQK